MSTEKKGSVDRSSILKELETIRESERAVDEELHRYVLELTGQRGGQNKGSVHETVNLTHSLDKIVEFDPCFEAMIQDSKKLASQIYDCKTLSDRLSSLVRRLDIVQIRAQQALACTEDVINLKSCRQGIETALEEKKLQVAVSFVKMVHDIDPEVAKSSDDYGPVLQAERETKALVHEEFKRAVQSSDIQTVISLCPTLQTLGLENEARDSFLDFIEKNVFIAVSAEACAVDVTEPATGYAQALSNIFNTAFAIIQQYLPVVIEGMENSNGDIFFIRKLHAKCAKEASNILKSYMKYRGMIDMLSAIKSGAGRAAVASAEVHVVLDEFALLLQYCCSYSAYMSDLCQNAETPRGSQAKSAGSKGADIGQRIVFDASHENSFDKMIEELVTEYYLEFEKWLIVRGAQSFMTTSKGSSAPTDSSSGSVGAASDQSTSAADANVNGGLDEFFFVLQRCGLRSVGTSNIQAACQVLHIITDCLLGDIMKHTMSRLNGAVAKLTVILTDIVAKWGRRDADAASGSSSFSSGIKSAFSLASSLTSVTSSSGAPVVELREDTLETLLRSSRDALEPFNTCSLLIRYVDRLSKDILAAGRDVFGGPGASSKTSQGSTALGNHNSLSDSLSKIVLSKEDFSNVQTTYKKALLNAAEQIVLSFDSALRALLAHVLGKQGPQGGVKWNTPDDAFDMQPAVGLLPKSVVGPIEILISLCTFEASDYVKENIMTLIVDTTARRLEQYVLQSTFSFAGALKFEECIRAISSLLSRTASSSVRSKFSRIREIMAVLTSDSGGNASAEEFLSLSTEDVKTYLDLRVDFVDSKK